MAVLDNRVPTYVVENGILRKGKSLRDHFAYCSENKSLMMMYFNDGMAQMMRRMPKKFCRQVIVATYKMSSQPGGLELALRHPEVSQLRCECRDSCFDDVVTYLKTVETERNDVSLKNHELKKKVKEMEEKQERTQERIAASIIALQEGRKTSDVISQLAKITAEKMGTDK